MDKQEKMKSSYEAQKMNFSCCKVEAVASIDERGQMVLPKEVREKANIKPGDKLAVVVWEIEGKVCCINLIKADAIAGMVKDLLSPMMEGTSW
ncbi:MAG: HgcAB-associated protein [Candidatus Aminicenantes bacterium]|jgi:AbrB family looped-hinge helix DNA binding protein